MKNFRFALTALFFGILLSNVKSQEIIINTEYWIHGGGIQKDQNSNLILTANFNDSVYFWKSMIIKVMPDFEYTYYIIDDTTNSLESGPILITKNNRILLSCIEMPEGGYDFDHLIITGFDENLNQLFFKRYYLEPQYEGEAPISLIQNDDGRIFGFGARFGDVFVALELNENGDTIRSKIFPQSPGAPLTSDVISSNNDSIALYAFVEGLENNSSKYQVVSLDTSFNYSWEYIETESGFPQDVRATWLNDSIYIGVGFKPQPSADEDLLIYKANANQNHAIVGSPLLLERPEYSDIPACNIPTFVSSDFIYAGSNSPSGPDIPYDSYYMVCVFDESLNVLGMKTLGKPGYQYNLAGMQATDDLGCVVVGNVHNLATDSIYDIDLFIRKIMPDEIVEVAEHTADPYDSDYFIYPNPGSDELNINTARKGVELRIVNMAGKEVMYKKLDNTFLNTLNVSDFKSGNYILQFKDKEGYKENLKWIKK